VSLAKRRRTPAAREAICVRGFSVYFHVSVFDRRRCGVALELDVRTRGAKNSRNPYYYKYVHGTIWDKHLQRKSRVDHRRRGAKQSEADHEHDISRNETPAPVRCNHPRSLAIVPGIPSKIVSDCDLLEPNCWRTAVIPRRFPQSYYSYLFLCSSCLWVNALAATFHHLDEGRNTE
jgi:hypothetical protein